MRKFAPVVMMTLFCALLMGAASPSAPVVSTKGYYVNDYASLLFDSHKNDILALSTKLFDATGVQIVVLTVPSLGELDIDAYADAIFRDWEIGGPQGENGALILVAKDEKSVSIKVGAGLEYLMDSLNANVSVGGRGDSKYIMNLYRPMVSAVYTHLGIEPSEDTRAILDNPAEAKSKPFSAWTALFLVGVLLLMGRSMGISRKYRRKYLKGNVRQVKTYTRSYDEEDQYKDEKPDEIRYDNMD